ncbi:hypothetical protein Hbl1158_10895 [Halobaculum sp. CBA1158]|uniref:hypothetical protein n=1 Tax=Halobaculum sp. CBA1158 TaxID=2904243 RepID=UPI001F39487C|nr:hypothetical protein [Halobaculum sp. CBA1158]UIO99039.1 hypothetical protein Hbl1158_10895 [Halobaculum sp. CBA1158]
MTDPDGSDPTARRDEAVRALVDRQPTRAGDLYTLVGRGTLAGREAEGHDRGVLGNSAGYAGYGLRYLLLAAFAYRAAGADRRARLRAREGSAVAADYVDVVETDAERACWFEGTGDLAAAAGLDDAGADAYDRATELYRDADESDPLSRATDPLFEAIRLGPQQAARHTGHDFDWDDLHGPDPDATEYLAHRSRFKRSRVPRVAEAVADAGFLAPPRGTTEHGNADYVCPDCGRSEVNWTAGIEICLDCDVRMREA